MEEKFNKLDRFLREHLHDASENHAWNVPDDSIFEKAMRTVAEGKKEKRRGWILIPVLLTGGLLISEYFHNRQIENLEGKITRLEENLSRESSTIDPLTSTSSNVEEGIQSQQSNSFNGNQKINTPSAASETTPYTRPIANPEAKISHNSAELSAGFNNKSLDKPSAKTKSTVSPIASSGIPSHDKTSSTGQTKSAPISLNAASDKPAGVSSSNTTTTIINPLIPGDAKTGENQEKILSGLPFAGPWMTEPISTLALKSLAIEEPLPFVIPSIAANTLNSTQANPLPAYTMSYGLLLGVNQSWLTMKNIPPVMDANLYAYENTHPGFSMQGFVNKPFSPKFSFQAGLGFHVYNNRSILEDQFLFDTDHVEHMPNGEDMYMTDYNLVNPIGEYSMLLEFRVSEQMNENDVVVEYTTIEQTIQSVMLDLGVQYDLLTLNDFKLSLGTGLGIGYMACLKNEFDVSTYHNGILQENQMETPDHLNSVNKWYGQWLGNLTIGYYPTRRMGIILATQYNTGLTSIRDGGSANGPLTFLHAFSLSAGVSHSF